MAVALARAVAARLGRQLDEATVTDALAGTTWPGRLERVGTDLLLDCAHNAEGARALAAALPEIAAGRRIVFLMSVAEDKDVRGILAALGRSAYALVATRAESPRALPAGGARRGSGAVLFQDGPSSPIRRPRSPRRAGGAAGGLVVVCGSMFLVGPLRAALLGETVDPQRTSDPVFAGRGSADGRCRYQPATWRPRGTALRRGGRAERRRRSWPPASARSRW